MGKENYLRKEDELVDVSFLQQQIDRNFFLTDVYE